MASETSKLGALALGLLALMVILGLTFVVGAQFQKTICEDIDGAYSTGSSCTVSLLNTNISQSNAYNVTGDVITAIELVVSFLSIIVLILIVKMLVSNAKSISMD